jgi:hypothetical protein
MQAKGQAKIADYKTISKMLHENNNHQSKIKG